MSSTDYCCVTKLHYNKFAIHECKNKAVVFKYGVNGKAYVCYLVCQKCKFGRIDPYVGGASCTYQRGEADG